MSQQPDRAGVPRSTFARRKHARRKDLVHAAKAALLSAAARLFAARPVRSAGPPAGLVMRPGATPHLLVVRLDNRLGNLLLLTPFLQRLREALPAARLGFVCGEAYASLLQHWPWIDEWIVQPKRRHASFPPLFLPWVAGLRRRGWDLAIEASNPDTHSFYNCFLAIAAGAPERIGFDHPRSRPALTRAVPPPASDLHFSLAPLRLLRELGLEAPAAPMRCPLSDTPSPAMAAWKKREGIGNGHVVVHLGGRGPKAWPDEGWARLLPALAREVAAPIVVVAGRAEQDRLTALWNAGRPRLVRAPLLSVPDLGALLRNAAAFVGCDSGVMHLAIAVGTPTTAIFFHSNPWRYAPLGSEHRTVLLADPYEVDDEAWALPVEGLSRSPLRRGVVDRTVSRNGIPDTGPVAAEAVRRAFHEARVPGR